MKILVGITTARKFKYAAGDQAGHRDSPTNPRIQAVLDTWYRAWAEKYSDKINVRLFVGTGDQEVRFPNLVELGCPDGYYDLPAKVKAMFKWALDAGYDYVAKVDDDVYVRCPNLLKFFQPVDYCGYELESNTDKWASGAAYVVSRRAMQLVVDTPWDPTWNSAEDQMVGRILAGNGIGLVHDHRYLCCHCDTCLKKFGLENLITIHTRSPQQMYDLHTKFAGL
jgi:galactosyltransferase